MSECPIQGLSLAFAESPWQRGTLAPCERTSVHTTEDPEAAQSLLRPGLGYKRKTRAQSLVNEAALKYQLNMAAAITAA